MQDEEKFVSRTGYIHLAFSAGSKEKVDSLTEREKKLDFVHFSELENGKESLHIGKVLECLQMLGINISLINREDE